MAHQTISQWAMSGLSGLLSAGVSLACSGFSALTSLVAYAATDDPDLASHALNLSAGSLVFGAVTILGYVIKGFWDDRKDSRARDLERFKAKIEADRVADADRRANDRELDTAQAVRLRNELDAANARIKALTEGQRINGRAIEQIGSSADIPVRVAIPPDGSGDHPTLP